VGGWDGTDATSTTDLYSSTSFRFFPGPPMSEKRDFHDAVTLEDGRVLVTGGLSYSPTGANFSDTAEIYDPVSRTWRFTAGRPIRRRGGHELTLLPDGRVLISGGEPSGTASGSIEFFDPVSETFRSGANNSGSGRQNHALAQITGQGNLLFADGGSALVEFFNPLTEQFQGAGVGSVPVRTYSTASPLPDGKVLIVGGFDRTNPRDTLALRSIDLYVPGLGDVGRVVNVNVQLALPRAGHSAHAISGGRIIFVGGVGTSSPVSLSSIEVFTPRVTAK